jgi:hypothetical protein
MSDLVLKPHVHLVPGALPLMLKLTHIISIHRWDTPGLWLYNVLFLNCLFAMKCISWTVTCVMCHETGVSYERCCTLAIAPCRQMLEWCFYYIIDSVTFPWFMSVFAYFDAMWCVCLRMVLMAVYGFKSESDRNMDKTAQWGTAYLLLLK